jgi:integration host factor subunit beta
MKTIVKKDLVRMVAAKTGQSLEEVTPLVDGVFKTLRLIMAHADPEIRIEIRGFGVLGVKMTKAKPKARNPRTQEIIFVPPHKKTFFKAGKTLKEDLHKPLPE